ncbi:peptidylprolyl isomerase [Acinetobacter sp. ULE_I001]|uniref:peptidylprolyl isomerase n=1 Tax=unclassified Acinetobacter TaxID=196816 RepID=UPI003AF81E94
MIKKIGIGLALVVLVNQAFANTDMQIKTNLGNINIELYDDQAPISVKNFKSYVNSQFYNGTIFHRVIPDFMIQGGGFDSNMKEKSTQPAIQNESSNGLKNVRGTLAMARTNAPNSATSQFFINVANNDFLNKSAGNSGYAVFGKVTQGLDIVDKIVQTPTQTVGMHQDVPKQAVKIISIQTIKTNVKK